MVYQVSVNIENKVLEEKESPDSRKPCNTSL